MKLSVGKRIFMFFHWLLSLLICVGFALYLIVPDFVMKYYGIVEQALGAQNMKYVGIGILVLYAIFAIVQICLIFKRRKRDERGFITVDSSDAGRVRIAVSAIEEMVRQSVNNIDGITEMKICIENLDDAIGIIVNATIENGNHVPTITMNMQRSIRQFVELNCGVAVRTVSISINAVTPQPDANRRRRHTRKAGSIPAALAAPANPEREGTVQDEPQPREAPIEAAENGAESEAVQTRTEEAVSEPNVPVFEPSAYRDEPVSQDIPAEDQRPEPGEADGGDDVSAEQPVLDAEEESEPYDINKPYVSEFAKDLAAMKAREAAKAAEAAEEAPETFGDYQ